MVCSFPWRSAKNWRQPKKWKTINRNRYTSEIIVNDILQEDQRKTCEEIAQEARMSVGSVYKIITNNLKLRKVAPRWVPHHLSDKQKVCRQRIAEELLHHYQTEGEEFLKRIVALDETWMWDFEPELKSQLSQWKHTVSPHPKKMLPPTIKGETDDNLCVWH